MIAVVMLLQQVDMPVFFYIDPDFCEDPKMEKVNVITLSYTFFEAKEGQHLSVPNYFRPHPQWCCLWNLEERVKYCWLPGDSWICGILIKLLLFCHWSYLGIVSPKLSEFAYNLQDSSLTRPFYLKEHGGRLHPVWAKGDKSPLDQWNCDNCIGPGRIFLLTIFILAR